MTRLEAGKGEDSEIPTQKREVSMIRMVTGILVLMLAGLCAATCAAGPVGRTNDEGKQGMDVFESVKGPEPYRVYQREADNLASVQISGSISEKAAGPVEARVTRGGKALKGLDWTSLKLDGRAFSGALKGVPMGGPYVIEMRAKGGSRRIPGILVGDLWILAGQSNMDGCGKLTNLEEPSPYVNCFYYSETWGIARDPLCVLIESVDPIHTPNAKAEPEARAAAISYDKTFREHGAGLGVRFGKDMYQATGVPVGLIVCSHGGTSLAQWSPKLKDKGGDSLYGSMLRRVGVAGGKVAGCLWYQGESDAMSEAWKDYKANFRDLIENIRADMKRPDLPFVYVQLSRYFVGDAATTRQWNSVQNDQLLIEGEMESIAFAAAIDCTLSDVIHIDAISQRRMGAQMAKLARKLAFGEKIEVGPRPGKVEFIDTTRTKIRVSFTGVNGALVPESGIRGFVVEKGDAPSAIAGAVRGPDGKSVIITLDGPAPEGANLWYGRGLNPATNLADKGGFAAPVFGPLALP